MSGEALALVPEDPPQAPPRRGWPVFGVVVALGASAGLVWWLAAPLGPRPAPVVVVQAAPKPPVRAPATADPAQVQRAFEAVQDAYAEGGAAGLSRADADCAEALKADSRVLDYCLAFDLFATAVAPEIARADAAEARLEAARAALPAGLDPAERVAQVRVLMRQASLGTVPQAPASAPPVPPIRVAQAQAHSPHPRSRVADQRREAARAAVRALFARAEAAHDAASDADAIAQLYAERTRPPPPPPDDTAPH